MNAVGVDIQTYSDLWIFITRLVAKSSRYPQYQEPYQQIDLLKK